MLRNGHSFLMDEQSRVAASRADDDRRAVPFSLWGQYCGQIGLVHRPVASRARHMAVGPQGNIEVHMQFFGEPVMVRGAQMQGNRSGQQQPSNRRHIPHLIAFSRRIPPSSVQFAEFLDSSRAIAKFLGVDAHSVQHRHVQVIQRSRVGNLHVAATFD